MVRTIAGVLTGVVVLGLVVTLIQQLSATLHPLPPGLDPTDPADAASFAEHVAGMPGLAWVAALLSEVLGAGAGALTAGAIARDAMRGATGVVVGLATLGSVMNWMAFPHPAWFIGGQLLLYPAVLVAVWALYSKRAPAATADLRVLDDPVAACAPCFSPDPHAAGDPRLREEAPLGPDVAFVGLPEARTNPVPLGSQVLHRGEADLVERASVEAPAVAPEPSPGPRRGVAVHPERHLPAWEAKQQGTFFGRAPRADLDALRSVAARAGQDVADGVEHRLGSSQGQGTRPWGSAPGARTR